MGVITPGLGISYDDGSICFSPQMRPKLALGNHGKLWSMNIILESNFLFYIKNSGKLNVLETADVSFSIARRF
jgi:hypothetical protein